MTHVEFCIGIGGSSRPEGSGDIRCPSSVEENILSERAIVVERL